MATSELRAPGAIPVVTSRERSAGSASVRRWRLSPQARFTLVAALLSLAAGNGCTQIDNALASVPTFSFMRNSPFFDPYEHPLPPPPGSVPFESPNGLVLPPLEGTPQALTEFAAGEWGRNPLAADDQAALALGQIMYERHCSVCHGLTGAGDGPLTGPGKFGGTVPPVVSGNALTLSDGYVYGIIRAGRGLMPAYGPRMTHIERWAVVTYVNQMQANSAGAAPQPAPGAQQPAPGAGQAPGTTGGTPPDTAPARQ